MRAALSVLVLALVSSAVAKPKNRFTRYPSWNTRMFPIWKDGDPRYADSWKGGHVKFIVGNDAPTLTGAKVTFTIDLEFPHNQKIMPSGEVVWAQDCTVNGTNYRESEPVYPTQNTEWKGIFPDGTPFKKDKQPSYVFVWKTWDQYWQVSDGPSSSLTISTDNIPLGSYTVDIVIYHYRSKEKFIPLGYASTEFSITDQIPFAVSLTQVNDIDEADLRFVQNRAIAFSVSLHDPSQYLSNADITYNWDFGDNSGALISRELTVTHTYVSSGSFRPKVVVQAVIPDIRCVTPANTPTVNSVTLLPPGPHSDMASTASAPADASAAPVLSSQRTVFSLDVGPTAPAEMDSEEDVTEDEASSTSAAPAAQDAVQLVQTPSPINPGVPTGPALAPAASKALEMAGGEAVTADRAATKTGPGPSVVVAKRDANDPPSDDDCVIYRYGSFCTGIDVVEGIESVEIVQVSNTVLKTPEAEKNVVDLTITCAGSHPTEVCSVVLDADCMRPVHTECNAVAPSPECQLVLRHFFNNSGVYCINVSMTNDFSLAVTSARVNVDMGSALSSSATVAMMGMLGVLIVALTVGTVAHTYKHRHFNSESEKSRVSPGRTCVPGMFWNCLGRRSAVDNCPLLQDRLV
ncbi:premelanosome protein b [Osmerus eperlanus]|uniref:premelanosome protein b n=1 Tax=Osmerus eperlanus TaxID=29151 RepID=UPI002E15DD83